MHWHDRERLDEVEAESSATKHTLGVYSDYMQKLEDRLAILEAAWNSVFVKRESWERRKP